MGRLNASLNLTEEGRSLTQNLVEAPLLVTIMKRRTVFLSLGAAFLAAVIALTTGVLVWRMAKRSLVETVLTPEEKTLDISTLVTQVRELNRLETASMRVIHVGRITQSYKLVPNAIAGDEITFLATGDVIAGIDLAKLKQEDVWRSPDGTINLRLPPPEVLVTRVDNKESRVLARDTGVLRRMDVDLIAVGKVLGPSALG